MNNEDDSFDLEVAKALSRLDDVVTSKDVREGIVKLQGALEGYPQGDYPLKHHFADGQYAREIFLPKNNFIVGKIHKHAHINIISMGDVTVVTEFGIQRLKAPCTFVSRPGTKRALFTHEDTIWTTVHVTDETDIPTIEDQLIAKSYAEYDELAYQRNLSLAIGQAMTQPTTMVEEERDQE